MSEKVEPGITQCFKCEKPLTPDKIGYCDGCMEELEHQEHMSDYYSLFELQRYAEARRKEIIDFMNNEEYSVEHIRFEDLKEKNNAEFGNNVYAILSPELAASLDYSLIHRVSYVSKIDEDRYKWFKDYWFEKYEIEIQETEFEAGLEFHGWSDYYQAPYVSIYDYPASLLQAYVRKVDK